MRWAGETPGARVRRLARWRPAFAYLPTQIVGGSWVWWEPLMMRDVPLHSGGVRRDYRLADDPLAVNELEAKTQPSPASRFWRGWTP